MSLSREPPLRMVSSFMESEPDSPSVAVRLSEPIWRYGAAAHVELLVRCVQLQQLLERETLCSSAVATLEHGKERRIVPSWPARNGGGR